LGSHFLIAPPLSFPCGLALGISFALITMSIVISRGDLRTLKLVAGKTNEMVSAIRSAPPRRGGNRAPIDGRSIASEWFILAASIAAKHGQVFPVSGG
jgi:hypothetical protein